LNPVIDQLSKKNAYFYDREQPGFSANDIAGIYLKISLYNTKTVFRQHKPDPSMDKKTIEKYKAVIHEQMESILDLYARFADSKPVMLYDIQEKKIYAYPYKDYIEDLNEKSNYITIEQYEDTVSKNQVVVFVRDNEKRQLLSFTFPL
jgi:hypothetical protein